MMLTHHGTHGKLKLFHLEDGGFNHQRDYKFSDSELYLKHNFCVDTLKNATLLTKSILNDHDALRTFIDTLEKSLCYSKVTDGDATQSNSADNGYNITNSDVVVTEISKNHPIWISDIIPSGAIVVGGVIIAGYSITALNNKLAAAKLALQSVYSGGSSSSGGESIDDIINRIDAYVNKCMDSNVIDKYLDHCMTVYQEKYTVYRTNCIHNLRNALSSQDKTVQALLSPDVIDLVEKSDINNIFAEHTHAVLKNDIGILLNNRMKDILTHYWSEQFIFSQPEDIILCDVLECDPDSHFVRYMDNLIGVVCGKVQRTTLRIKGYHL